ncbi:methyltransferase domain-containing protein [Porcipelethomonas ammoniilytica]|uniref:methyltransferase domain-containing protein n=1 Tax=Porcipelethomonas ammoniilytica TaxID=2981722 RepID=UPI000821587D|nr:methyltransferase domain-containing protein [Porcipelethomonas ammoniilytica]MCU6720364.1 methyltransferase domain-containing protein [Porcipelethomonas ammoniilytica]SCJ10768.1 16S RNA G1207 methylase RsmC [uncultured Ruminococcus sp.]
MNIEEQFNLIAKEYDANRKKFIPCFDEFYEYTTKFIASNIETPKQILDLGAGTGILSYFWFQHFPKSEYVLVDIADDMLNSSEINTWFDSYWEHQLKNSGLTAKDIELWKERRKLDIECSVEEEMDMLRKCNFKEVKCIYSNQKFSVIVAIK